MTKTTSISFLLVRLFPLYLLVLATEVLRLANGYAGKRLFDWSYTSIDGLDVEACNGIKVGVENTLTEGTLSANYVLVTAGHDPLADFCLPMKRALQQLNRQNIVLGTIDSGAFILAEAQLLKHQTITLHPICVEAFTERFRSENISVDPNEVLIEEKRISCAGGLSVVSMMLHLVGKHGGEALVHAVAHDLRLDPAKIPEQNISTRNSRAIDPSALIDRVSSLMRAYIEVPLQVPELAKQLGVSERTLFRLFNNELGLSPSRYYVILRLQHARHTLLQSQCSMTEIALACGFSSLGSFSRAFKREFGVLPKHMLEHFRKYGYSEMVPQAYSKTRLDLAQN